MHDHFSAPFLLKDRLQPIPKVTKRRNFVLAWAIGVPTVQSDLARAGALLYVTQTRRWQDLSEISKHLRKTCIMLRTKLFLKCEVQPLEVRDRLILAEGLRVWCLVGPMNCRPDVT